MTPPLHIVWYFRRQTDYENAVMIGESYCDVIKGAMASQITSFTIICSTVDPGPDQRKHQRSVSLAFVSGIHRWAANSPHKGPVTRKMFPFDDVVMSIDTGNWVKHWITECKYMDDIKYQNCFSGVVFTRNMQWSYIFETKSDLIIYCRVLPTGHVISGKCYQDNIPLI